jgi:hypothetical protein
MYFPSPRQAYAASNTLRFIVDGTGFVEPRLGFKYLGSVINYPRTSNADLCKRIKSATAAFGAFKNLFGDKCLSEKPKSKCTQPRSCPLCSMAAKFGTFKKMYFSDFGERFHDHSARRMCRTSIVHSIRNIITSGSVVRRLGILDIGSYYHSRVLR